MAFSSKRLLLTNETMIPAKQKRRPHMLLLWPSAAAAGEEMDVSSEGSFLLDESISVMVLLLLLPFFSICCACNVGVAFVSRPSTSLSATDCGLIGRLSKDGLINELMNDSALKA